MSKAEARQIVKEIDGNILLKSEEERNSDQSEDQDEVQAAPGLIRPQDLAAKR